jgi:hypothetical protein
MSSWSDTRCGHVLIHGFPCSDALNYLPQCPLDAHPSLRRCLSSHCGFAMVKFIERLNDVVSYILLAIFVFFTIYLGCKLVCRKMVQVRGVRRSKRASWITVYSMQSHPSSYRKFDKLIILDRNSCRPHNMGKADMLIVLQFFNFSLYLSKAAMVYIVRFPPIPLSAMFMSFVDLRQRQHPIRFWWPVCLPHTR